MKKHYILKFTYTKKYAEVTKNNLKHNQICLDIDHAKRVIKKWNEKENITNIENIELVEVTTTTKQIKL